MCLNLFFILSPRIGKINFHHLVHDTKNHPWVFILPGKPCERIISQNVDCRTLLTYRIVLAQISFLQTSSMYVKRRIISERTISLFTRCFLGKPPRKRTHKQTLRSTSDDSQHKLLVSRKSLLQY